MPVTDRDNVRPIRPPPSDSALVEQSLAKNEWARDELYRRHAPWVRRVLVRVAGFRPEVDDLLQEVFVVAFRSLGQLRESAAFRSWLLQIATYVARNHLRSKRRWSWIRLGEDEDDVAAPIADESTRLATRATYRILAKMDPDEQTAFALRYFEQLELTEVAEACGVSLATIKRRLDRAQEAFFKHASVDPLLADRVTAMRSR